MRIIFLCFFVIVQLHTSAQVTLQTGAASFSLPLYSYENKQNRIGCSVSLNYVDGNGMKVSEIASPVGTGWSLQAGGVITRVQRGEPDDQKNNIGYSDDYTSNGYIQNYFPDGYLYTSFSPLDVIGNGAAFTPLYLAPEPVKMPKKYLADREADLFSFSFNGRTGQFVFGKDGSIRTIEDSKLIITIDTSDMWPQGIRTKVSSFKIKDEMGIVYVFKDLELSEVLKYNKTIRNNMLYDYLYNNLKTDVLTAEGTGQYVVTKWFLSEIINPLTNKKIEFHYEDFLIDIYGDVIQQRSYRTPLADIYPPTYMNTLQRIKGRSKRLISLTTPTEEIVEFEYSSFNRYDVRCDKALKAVQIKYGNQLKFSWKFSYKYFNGSWYLPFDATETQVGDRAGLLRLCLENVQKTGAQSKEPPYQFDYYNDYVPPMFSLTHDDWGYYNGWWDVWHYQKPITSVSRYILDGIEEGFQNYRAINDGWAKNGIIKTITYPQGGKLSYEYEQNDVLDNNNMVQVGGVRVKKTTLFDGHNHVNDISTTYNYKNGNGLSSGWGYEPFEHSLATQLTITTSKNISSPAIINNVTVATLFNTTAETDKVYNKIVDGKKLGPVLGYLGAKMLIASVVHYLIGLFNENDIHSETYPTKLFSLEPLYYNSKEFQYSRVEVQSIQQNINQGTIINEFYTDLDLPYFIPILSYPFSNRQRCALGFYGLPKRITVKDRLGKTKKITNNIVTPKWIIGNDNFVSQKWDPNQRFFKSANTTFLNWNNGPDDPTFSYAITSEKYYPYFGHNELTKIEEYTYDPSGTNYTLKSTQYEYSPKNYQVSKIKTTNSKGENIESRSYYTPDFSGNSICQSLVSNNMVSLPVLNQVFITKPTGSYLVSGTYNELSLLPNNDYGVVKQYVFQNTIPVAESLVPFNSSQVIPNAQYFKEVKNNTYNNEGNLVAEKNNRAKNSYIYSYGGAITVATVFNANPEDVAYTSFEAADKGGWNYDENFIHADFSPTGNKHFSFSPTSATALTRNLDVSRKYKLAFWAKGTIPLVYYLQPPSGFSTAYVPIYFSPVASYANAQTGWTYYEYLLTSAANIYIANSRSQPDEVPPFLSASIDEVRLYPIGATMNTATYEPIIGKTSECDINGRITYYEYDDLGRLKGIRDEDRNLVKAYEYNTRTVFKNAAKSQSFTKTCPAGYNSSLYTYMVPEAKYTSAVSQADADQQAQNEITANGQIIANSQCSCSLSQTVYTSISYENIWSSGDQTYGDVVVRFYADPGLTLPFTVFNYNLTYSTIDYCGYLPQYHSITANGNQVIIASGALLSYASWVWDPYNYDYIWQTCFIDYQL